MLPATSKLTYSPPDPFQPPIPAVVGTLASLGTPQKTGLTPPLQPHSQAAALVENPSAAAQDLQDLDPHPAHAPDQWAGVGISTPGDGRRGARTAPEARVPTRGRHSPAPEK